MNGLETARSLVLVVDDDAAVRDALVQTLELAEITPISAGSFVAAKDHITAAFEGVILSDIRMPGRDGFHLLHYAHKADPDLPVVLLTGEGDIPMAVDAMAKGAFGFLEKPCAPADLVAVLRRALAARAMVLENRALKLQLETGDPAARMLFGTSQLAADLRARVRAVARTGAEVLVKGPPGAGVPKVAEVIHLMSPKATGPFVKKTAVALSSDGFHTACAEAAGGSLFLDEISALPSETQYAVLACIENGAGPRILAGSTTDLEAEVANGFHAELYYRLDVVPVRIPSLAERPEDIPVLFRHYVAQAAEQSGIPAPEISPDHLAALMAQDWPGNARALMSAAMRFVLGMPGEAAESHNLGLSEQMARVECTLLIAALGRQNGRAAATAEALKLPRKTFYDKLARYGIRPEDYRR
ncbi:C4-dicarboxylate transport transcriptional regulatory protein [hydrothermal vent metagenome]|uniref:C4-dicarboxylate transport transcriptional regulatory protein n=1 Tax=hydrothermal vent metagenome TaxID=652676 RepID=A0A3B0RE84_9ZZZZ